MTTFNNIQKTPLAVDILNAVVQDTQNRVYMNGDNKVYREASTNPWDNVGKTT